MASHYKKADEKLLKPGVVVGKCPDTGVIHRLTIYENGAIKIERKPYVSDNPDGWTQHYEPLTSDAEKHIFLILKIRNNPAEWSE